MENVEHLNGLSLAYVGDAAYEICVREYLIQQGISKPNHLHKQATAYVSAKGQAMLMMAMLEKEDFLTEQELAVYKRGRNAKSHTVAKNTDVMTYRISTGFEAVLGYLYLTKQIERFNKIVQWCIQFIGDKNAKKA